MARPETLSARVRPRVARPGRPRSPFTSLPSNPSGSDFLPSTHILACLTTLLASALIALPSSFPCILSPPEWRKSVRSPNISSVSAHHTVGTASTFRNLSGAFLHRRSAFRKSFRFAAANMPLGVPLGLRTCPSLAAHFREHDTGCTHAWVALSGPSRTGCLGTCPEQHLLSLRMAAARIAQMPPLMLDDGVLHRLQHEGLAVRSRPQP